MPHHSSRLGDATDAGQGSLPLREDVAQLPFTEGPAHDDHDVERELQLGENCAESFTNEPPCSISLHRTTDLAGGGDTQSYGTLAAGLYDEHEAVAVDACSLGLDDQE